jgi:hypothetical protein
VGCEHPAAAGPGLLADEQVTEDAFAAYDRLGVILVVMPWNYRFWHSAFRACPHSGDELSTRPFVLAADVKRSSSAGCPWPHGGGDPTMAR